ncbi:MAG: ankyrin repeat domain-containing protein [Candidatus Amoebophilus sp.]
MKLKFFKTYQILSYLLLMIFTLESCEGDPYTNEAEMTKMREHYKEETKARLLAITPLAGLQEKHLVRLYQYVAVHNSSTLASPSSIVISLGTNMSSTTGSTDTSNNSTIKREPSVRIKEEKSEEEEDKKEKVEVVNSITAQPDTNSLNVNRDPQDDLLRKRRDKGKEKLEVDEEVNGEAEIDKETQADGEAEVEIDEEIEVDAEEKAEIINLSKTKIELNNTDKKKSNPLHIAINKPHTELAGHLLATKLNHIHIEDIDHFEGTKLQHLVLKKLKNTLLLQAKEEIVELLLEKNADVNVPDANANMPLHLAAENGYLEIVELLLDNGAHTNPKNTEVNSALHLAAKNGHLNIVKLLVSRGSTIDAVNSNEMTPIHIAAQHEHSEVVHFLLEKKANHRAEDGQENTLLHYAAEAGLLDIVDLLLERNFKRDVKNKGITTTYGVSRGSTPLQLAVKKGHPEIVKKLIEHGANLKVLVDDHPDTSSINQGNTLLHIATQNSDIEMIKFLILEKQMNVNSKNHWDFTPLHFAARSGSLEVVKWLVENGANLEAKSSTYYNTSTPLSLAIVNGHLEVANFLIKKRAKITREMKVLINIQRKNHIYPTLLHFVAENNDTKLASLLIRNGADRNIKDEYGNTPLDIATKKNHSEIAEILKDPFVAVFEAEMEMKKDDFNIYV